MKISITALILSIIMFSCGNDSSESDMPADMVTIEAPDDLETAKTILSGDTLKAWVNQSFSLEVFGQLTCREDDIFTFFRDGTYEYDGGAELCGDSDNRQIVTGTWEIDLEKNKLVFDKGEDQEVIVDFITIKENLVRLRGSWNSLAIDASYVNQ